MKVPYESPQHRPRIELIPLIDVIFFLLATFLMVSLSMVKNQGVMVKLPRAATGEAQPIDHVVTLTVARDGAFYLNRQRVGFETLRSRLKEFSEKDRDLRVILNGDESADFGKVVKALDELRKLGIDRVAMRTTGAGER